MLQFSEIHANKVNSKSPIETAKTALALQYGVHRQVANEVALEYARLLDFRLTYGEVELPDSSLLRQFEQLVLGEKPSAEFSRVMTDGRISWPKLTVNYEARYGRRLPAWWREGAAKGNSAHFPPNVQSNLSNTLITPTHGMDPAPTGQDYAPPKPNFEPTGQEFGLTGQD